jgi:hypothetical protein
MVAMALGGGTLNEHMKSLKTRLPGRAVAGVIQDARGAGRGRTSSLM